MCKKKNANHTKSELKQEGEKQSISHFWVSFTFAMVTRLCVFDSFRCMGECWRQSWNTAERKGDKTVNPFSCGYTDLLQKMKKIYKQNASATSENMSKCIAAQKWSQKRMTTTIIIDEGFLYYPHAVPSKNGRPLLTRQSLFLYFNSATKWLDSCSFQSSEDLQINTKIGRKKAMPVRTICEIRVTLVCGQKKQQWDKTGGNHVATVINKF